MIENWLYNHSVGYYVATNWEKCRCENAPISRKGRLYWWWKRDL